MTRDEALKLVDQKVSNRNLKKHMLATEAVMKSLAQHFNEDESIWGLAGLLHDLDYDQTVNDFPKHGLLTAEILEKTDVPLSVINAVKSHPGHFPRKSLLDKVLYAVDPVTGLIVAAVLMHPSKKLNKVDVNFIVRRFKEKRFAAGADRDQIRSCEEFDMPLNEFIKYALEAMQNIDKELGL
jgi:putative nucleotidyltransferase with HDIG domain